MRTHPVFLRLEGRSCVIVGGNTAAEAKARACLDAGARVTLIAAELTTGLAMLAADGTVRHTPRSYRPGDLAGAVLAYAAVAEVEVIRQLRAEAERERVLLNVIDVPEACAFLAPAVVRRGQLQVAIGTGGASPAFAARLRREFEGRLGPEYAPFVAILGAVRRTLQEGPARRAVLDALLDSPLLDLVRQGRVGDVDRLLEQVAGAGVTLAHLGISLGAEAAS